MGPLEIVVIKLLKIATDDRSASAPLLAKPLAKSTTCQLTEYTVPIRSPTDAHSQRLQQLQQNTYPVNPSFSSLHVLSSQQIISNCHDSVMPKVLL
jgi:hypothetical protein